MYIQMVTALVLQLIQCVVHLPSDKDIFEEYDTKVGDAHLKHLVLVETCLGISFSYTAVLLQLIPLFVFVFCRLTRMC